MAKQPKINPDDFHILKEKKEGEWDNRLGILDLIEDTKKLLEIEQKRLVEVAQDMEKVVMNKVKREQQARYGKPGQKRRS